MTRRMTPSREHMRDHETQRRVREHHEGNWGEIDREIQTAMAGMAREYIAPLIQSSVKDIQENIAEMYPDLTEYQAQAAAFWALREGALLASAVCSISTGQTVFEFVSNARDTHLRLEGAVVPHEESEEIH